jgi:putative inorganic carbon (HCO3(-)) transporter
MLNGIKNLANNLVSSELPVVLVLVMLSFLFEGMLPLSVIIAFGYWFLRRFTRGYFTKRTPADISIVLLVLMSLVSLWVTTLPESTFLQVNRMMIGILSFYSLINGIRDRNKLRLAILGLILAGLLLAGIAPVSVEWVFDKFPIIPQSVYDAFPRLINDTVHRNVMAGTLILIFPYALALILFSLKPLGLTERVFLFVSMLVIFIIIVLAQSRGAFIALGAVFITLIILRFSWGWILVPFSLCGLLLFGYYIGLETLLNFISVGVSLTGLEGRIEVWSRSVYMIQDFPLSGIGMGSFGDVVDLMYPLFLEPPGSVPHAHNLFLQIAVDLGIPGFIAWISILIIIIVISLKIYQLGRSRSDSIISGVGAGMVASQVALFVHGITDAVTWGMVKPSPIVWIIWGLVISCFLILVSNKPYGYKPNTSY